jgi:type I restriction enzyme R subunit
MKEASARIKINRLLETAGWRFFADEGKPANIRLELTVTLTERTLNELGENFEKTKKGFVDFLLLNEKGFPFIVLEAKAEDKNPLSAKEQARKYARSQNCRFIILSNGNLHYFWDLDRGNPCIITAFPTPTSVAGYQKSVPGTKRLIEEPVGDDYIVLTQRPNFASEAAWKNESERPRFIEVNALRFLRPYQEKATARSQRRKSLKSSSRLRSGFGAAGKLAKQLKEADQRGVDLGLNDDEVTLTPSFPLGRAAPIASHCLSRSRPGGSAL